MLSIVALWRLRQEDHSKTEAILGYLSSRSAWVQYETLPQKRSGAEEVEMVLGVKCLLYKQSTDPQRLRKKS